MIPLGFPFVVSLDAGAKYAIKKDRRIHLSYAMWHIIEDLEGDELKRILALIPMTDLDQQPIKTIRKRKS